MAGQNQNDRFELPIYVGKAIPAGGRIGGFGLASRPSHALFARLREHAESIQQVGNLNLEDFYCRYLVVDDIWIPLGENLLIERFRPVWNAGLGGFGNHDPGKGRHQGARPEWDIVHEGRKWADRLQPNLKTKDELLLRVQSYIHDKSLASETTEQIISSDEIDIE